MITPFANVANQLSQKLKDIGFTRRDEQGKPTNIGTVHTFQGKEAPIVFFVLGADQQSSGAARWAVSEANIMNVAATRAKEEFYIIGDRKLYLGLGCDVIKDTDRVIRDYGKQHPDLVDEQVYMKAADGQSDEERAGRMTGTVRLVGKGKKSFYAYVTGNDGKEYVITEDIYAMTEHAEKVVRKGQKISFVPEEGSRKPLATEVRADLTAMHIEQMELKKVGANDSEFLYHLINNEEILRQLNAETTNPDDWIEIFTELQNNADEENYIVLADGKRAGWFSIGNLQSAEGVAHLKMAVLLPEYQGRGLGTRVLVKLLDIIKERGFRSVILFTNKDNRKAQQCYKKCGFEVVAELTNARSDHTCVKKYKMERKL